MKILTSIAPTKLDVQKYAIESWLNLGFDVVSFNHPSELSQIEQEFDNVEFHTVCKTAIEILGFNKPYIPILEFLKYIESNNEKCWIVNSDIILCGKDSIVHIDNELSSKGIVFGHRTDIKHRDSQHGKVYEVGFDYFVVSPKFVHFGINQKPDMFMGQPWWDYWLPIMALKSRIKLIRYIYPIAYHLIHTFAWDAHQFHILAKLMSEKLGIKHFNSGMVSAFATSVHATIMKEAEVHGKE